MEKLHGLSNVQGSSRGHFPLLPKGPSEAVYGGSVNSDRRVDMPSSSSTNFPIEPSWLEDLLNEPETPVNRRHRRSISDSFAFISENITGEESWLGSTTGGPAWGFQTPQYLNGQAPLARKLSSISEEREHLCQTSSSTIPPVPNSVKYAKEDTGCKGLGVSCPPSDSDGAGCKGLGISCPPLDSDRVNVVRNEMQTHGGSSSNTLKDSFGGSNGSQVKPSVTQPPSKPDVKQKQHNARRSRARKLLYIAELERNVQALQVEGAAVSAQLEFLDQQNLLLVMENRALKQRLESLSQEHLIKSLEQEMLDRELGRLQYLYQLQNLNPHQHQRQRQKQKAAVHRRGRSCDLDSQFSRLSLHPADSIAGSKGFP